MIESLIVICAMVLFAISALSNAYESSERKRLDKHKVKHTDNDNT